MQDKEGNEQLINKTSADLESIIEEKTKGAIFRSRSNWYNLGQVSSKYFFNLEKNRSGSRNMTVLKNDQGEEMTDIKTILKEQRKFYETLYTKDDSISFTYKNDTNVKVSDDDNKDLEAEFTMKELRAAVKSCKRNKSPGCDGLTAEFYIVFFEKIKDLLLSAIHYSEKIGQLYQSALRGIITCIPKKGRDPRFVKNLRPITLLNTDYKLIEKMIANRLKPILMNLIHEDQKGFLAERRIGANICCILDIMEYLENNSEEGVVISVDYEKCFDRIEVQSLLGALDYFGFKQKILGWTTILYNGAKSCVINSGHCSKWFNVTRSVKQGGPCSAYYFIICAEVLTILLRKNENIDAFHMGDFKKLFGQYADDMDLYCKPTKKNIDNIFDTLNHFNKNSGCKINYEKTTMYRIGKKNNSIAGIYTRGMSLVDDKVNVLGVWITEKTKLIEKNYEPLVAKTKATLNCWKGRGLDLIGKILIINSLIGSLFVYKMFVLPKIPKTLVDKLDYICTTFIWNNQKAKISKEQLQNCKQYGGLKLTNFSTKDDAIKVSWIPYLEKDTYLQFFMKAVLSQELGMDIWKCNMNVKDVEQTFKPTFWRDILIAWSKFNFQKEIVSPEDAASQFIWYNSHIRANKELLYFKNAHTSGLVYVSQLVTEKGKVKPPTVLVEKFNLTIMQYNSLISAIPREWFKILRDQNIAKLEHGQSRLEQICNTTKPVKLYYNTMIQKKDLMQKKHKKWEEILQISLDYDQFLQNFDNIKKCTQNVKMQSFQYRLLQHAIVCNKQLKTWKVIENENCTFCKSEVETTYHLFCVCPVTLSTQEHIIEYLTKECKIYDTIVITDYGTMFNLIDEDPAHIVTFLMLAWKVFIYTNRCVKVKPNILAFHRFIDNARKYEYYNAKANNKLKQYYEKWYQELPNLTEDAKHAQQVDLMINEMAI